MSFHQFILFIVGPLVGYLLGSIPFALLIGFSKGVDIRKVGSGNIGATNLGRTFGSRYFLLAFFFDAGKGFLPTLLISLLAHSWPELPKWAPLLTGIAAMLGHVFPVYLKFKGGKGVATSFGVILGIWPLFTLAGLAAAGVFMVVFMIWRYISLASLAGAGTFPIFVFLLGWSDQKILFTRPHLPWSDLIPLLAAATLISLLIIYKHRSNIQRLIAGTELKAGRKK